MHRPSRTLLPRPGRFRVVPWLASAIALGLSLTPAPLAAQVDFFFLRPVDVGGGPTTVVAADLDLDGRLDLATSDARNDSVSFVKGQGGGFAQGVPFAVGDSPVGLAACDLDNDGRPDLAAAHLSFDVPQVTVLLNRTANGVVAFDQASFDVGARASAIACEDLDDDGDRDLAVTLFDDQAAMTLFNDGAGAFTLGDLLAVERAPGSIDAGDLDGDGLADLIVANDQSASVSVLLNDPGAPGEFLPQRTIAVGSAPNEVVLADLDGDGDLDAATANRGVATATVLLNDGAAGFERRTDYPVAGLSLSIAAGDFDCDGATDLALGGDGPRRVSVLLGDPAAPGTFQPFFTSVSVLEDTRSLAPGDFDDNGHLDLGTAHFRPDRVSALMNQGQVTYSSFHRGGDDDDFQGGTEPAFRSPALEDFLDGASAFPPLDFDEADTDRWFGHTFNALSRCVVGAELEIRAEALGSDPSNDSLCLEVLDPGPEDRRFGWCSRFERLPEAGGQWFPGDRVTFTLDLSDLLPDGRGTTSVLELLRDGELDVIVQDDTRVDFLRLGLRTCCLCQDLLAPVRREAGLEDGFQLPEEPVTPRPELDEFTRDRTGSPSLLFDEDDGDRFFSHTFTGLPSCVESAHLRFAARPVLGGSGNDAINLQLDPAVPTFAWALRMHALPGAGGTWDQPQEGTFELDLGDLPPSNPGVTDILAELEKGYLDFLIQDDTAVDFADLSVTPCCTRPQPPDDDFVVSSAIPGFGFQAVITSPDGQQIQGRHEPACIDETLCFSGAVPGRSEVFLRVVGPKPNGKLWPTLVKFSTSQVEIWVKQLATDEVKYYHLPGARPGFDELPGLFDRNGFDPAGGAAAGASELVGRSLSLVERGADGEAPPVPDDGPFLSPEFPDFRFWVRLTNQQGAESPTRQEPSCIDETVCVSGAVPGRSEIFIRVVGPKPNGRLWPTLVRFTTSTVEVWIEQVSTGELRYYRLEGASPGDDDLTGLFDRQGFLP